MPDEIILEQPKDLRDQFVTLYFEGISFSSSSFVAGYNAMNDGLQKFISDFQACKLAQSKPQTQFDFLMGTYHLKTVNRIFVDFKNISAIHLNAPSSAITDTSMYPTAIGSVNVLLTFNSTVNTRSQIGFGANQLFMNAGFNNHLQDFINVYHNFLKSGTLPTTHDYIFRTNDWAIANHLYIDIKDVVSVVLFYKS